MSERDNAPTLVYESTHDRPTTHVQTDGDPDESLDDRREKAASTQRLVVKSTEATTGPLRLWLVTLLISFTAFLFGWNTAAMNGPTSGASGLGGLNATFCQPVLLETGNVTCSLIDFSDAWPPEVVTAITLVGAMFSALLSSVPTERFGRRAVILANDIPLIVGPLLASLAPSSYFGFSLLVLGRFITGVGVGTGSVVVPQLLSEISPAASRGSLVTVNQLLLTLGMVLTQIAFYALHGHVNGWRYAVGLGAVPAIVQLALFKFIPASPRWLVQHERPDEALEQLRAIRPSTHDCEAELRGIEESVKEDRLVTSNWSDLLSMKRVIIVGVGAMFIQIFTGINVVLYYSTTIFDKVGVPADALLLATIGITVVNFLATFVTVFLVDRLGRKPLLMGGMGLMFVSMVTSGLALLLGAADGVGSFIALGGVVVFIVGFAIGLGAVLWTILGEVFPNKVRSKGMSLCLACNWLFNFVLALSVLNIIELIGAPGLFLMFAGFLIFGLVFVYVLIPETRGKPLEDIQALFAAGITTLGEPSSEEESTLLRVT